MNVFELRHKLQRQSKTETLDPITGDITEAWTTVDQPQAKVDPVSGLETYRGQKLSPETTHLVTIWYRSGVDTTQRFLFGERELYIRSLRNIEEAGVWLECQCQETANG